MGQKDEILSTIATTPESEYTRGWDDGLEQSCHILETDEALSGVSHTAIKMALRMLRRAPGAGLPNGDPQVKP